MWSLIRADSDQLAETDASKRFRSKKTKRNDAIEGNNERNILIVFAFTNRLRLAELFMIGVYRWGPLSAFSFKSTQSRNDNINNHSNDRMWSLSTVVANVCRVLNYGPRTVTHHKLEFRSKSQCKQTLPKIQNLSITATWIKSKLNIFFIQRLISSK